MGKLAYLMMLVVVATTACNPKSDLVKPVSLELNPSQGLLFSAEATAAENKTISVTSSGKWTVASSVEWCVVTTNQDNTFTVSAKANPSTTLSRTATITVIAASENFSTATKTIAVEQKQLGAASITVTPQVLTLTHDQTAASVIGVATNQTLWGYVLSSGGASWLTVSKEQGKFTVTATANTGAARSATITLAAGEGSNSAQAIVTVNQDEAPRAAITPANTSVTIAYDQILAREVAVTTNQSLWGYTLSGGASSWLTVSKGEGKLTVMATANTGAARSATITLAAGEGSNSAQATIAVIQSADPTSIAMVDISAGSFLMGSPSTEAYFDASQGPQRTIPITAFKMSQCEITNAQFAHFLNVNRANISVTPLGSEYVAKMTFDGVSRFIAGSYVAGSGMNEKLANRYNPETGLWAPAAGYEDYPAVYVSWWGAKAYAEWVGATLPSESQWEYACRAQTTTAWYWGATESTGYPTYEWPLGSYLFESHPVGKKQPNAFGLYDMAGNVGELCIDDYLEGTYDFGPTTDFVYILNNSTAKSVRGGMNGRGRSAYRTYKPHEQLNMDIGFRIVKR